MKVFSALFLGVAVCVQARLGDNRKYVVELTKENFDQVIQENNSVFVDFYVPWCHFSKTFAPTWESFAKDVSFYGLTVIVAKVDCEAEPTLCIEQSVDQYPTTVWYEDAKKYPSMCNGNCDKDTLLISSEYYLTKKFGHDTDSVAVQSWQKSCKRERSSS